jgi:hypothetical protein
MTQEFIYAYNATQGLNSLSATSDLMGILAVVVITAILLGLTITGLESKIWKNKSLKYIGQSIYYFGWGLGGMVVFALPATIIWSIYNEASTGNISIPWEWIGYCVVGYVVISAFGWIVKTKVADKLPKQKKTDLKADSKSADYSSSDETDITWLVACIIAVGVGIVIVLKIGGM